MTLQEKIKQLPTSAGVYQYFDKNDKMQISWFRISRHQCLGILKQWSDNMIINNYIKDKEEKIKTIKGDDAQLNKLKVAR